MKEILTINMDATGRQNVLGNTLGSLGNANIRWQHIKYFEEKILSENEETCDVVKAPNYYAWLCLITEYIFGLMRHFCFLHDDLKSNNLNFKYSEISTAFYDKCAKLNLYAEIELEELHTLIIKILYLRHALIHNGFPNLLPAAHESFQKKRNKRSPSKKQKHFTNFEENKAREIISWYSNPGNFKLAKEEFMKIIVASCKVQEVSVGL